MRTATTTTAAPSTGVSTGASPGPSAGPSPARPVRPVRAPRRWLVTSVATMATACAAAVVTGPVLAAPAGAEVPTSPMSFTAVGARTSFVVPPEVTTIHVRAVGGSGGDGLGDGNGTAGGIGGFGGIVDSDIPVTPGQTFAITVGGHGASAGGAGGATGGDAGKSSNGDSSLTGAGGGGGASYVELDGYVVVAAGGGGGGGGASRSSFNTGAGGDGGNGFGGRGYYGKGSLAGAGGVGSSGSQQGASGENAGVVSEAGGGGGGGGGYSSDGGGGGAAGAAGTSPFVGGGAGGGGAGGMSFSAYSSTSSVSTTKGDGSVTLSWRTYYTTSGTLSSAQNPSVQGTTALVTANMSWSAFLPMFGTYTFGTHNPVTGVDVTLGSRTNSGQLADIRPTFAFTSLPLGINELWVAYSGDLNHSPWKSAYFQQWVIGQLHSVAVSPSPISFGEQLYSSVTTTSVTVTNTGNVPYAFTAISMAPSAFRLSASTCGGSLPVSASCSISVSFSPSYGGALSSTLTISDGTDVTSIPVSGSIKTSVTPGGPPPAPTAPTLSWISPSTGFRWGGTLVTITGTNLVNVTKVLFGSMPAPYVSCPSATTCYATAPAGYGSVDVRVMTPAGTTPVTFSDRFTYFG